MEAVTESQQRNENKKKTSDEYFELKTTIHDRLLDLIDLSLIDTLGREELISQIKGLVDKIMNER